MGHTYAKYINVEVRYLEREIHLLKSHYLHSRSVKLQLSFLPCTPKLFKVVVQNLNSMASLWGFHRNWKVIGDKGRYISI